MVRVHTLNALDKMQNLKLEDDRLGLSGFALEVSRYVLGCLQEGQQTLSLNKGTS
jgi:hypothetical protein